MISLLISLGDKSLRSWGVNAHLHLFSRHPTLHCTLVAHKVLIFPVFMERELSYHP